MTAETVVPAAVLVALMLAAIALDSSVRKLPNWLCLATFASGIAANVFAYGSSGIGSNLLHAFVALAITISLYAFRLIGAGDAKFYGATAAWFPFSQAANLLVCISGLGFVAVLVWLIALRIRRSRQPDRPRDGKFPLGVPIALGAMATFLAPLLLPHF